MTLHRRMNGHFIDLASWSRREHFELFRNAAQPFFSVTAEIDVTPLRERCSVAGGPSFFLSALYAALSAANRTEAFRRRVRNGQVWVHDAVHITSTIMRADDTFGFARFEMTGELADFLERGREEIARVKVIAPLELPGGDDALIYHSTIPWVRFTAFTNAIIIPSDSIPRVVFGRCVRDGSSWRMPVAVEVHHAVVDGVDVGRYFEKLQHEVQL